jgi:hypothetical protein
MTTSRPLAVYLLLVIVLLAALVSGWHMLQMLGVAPIKIGEMKFYANDIWGAILWGLSFAIYLWAASAIWAMNPSGLMFVIILSALNLVLAVFTWIFGTELQVLIPTFVINGLAFILAWLPSMREAYGISD